MVSKNRLCRHYDVISTKFGAGHSNLGKVLYHPTKFQSQTPTGNMVSKNSLRRHYDVISIKFGTQHSNPGKVLYHPAKF